MARAATEDPLKGYRFRVLVDGFERLGFSDVEPPTATVDVVEYRESGMNESPQLSAGLTKYGPVTLKRGQVIPRPGAAGADDFVRWFDQVHQVNVLGNAANYRKDIQIVQYNSNNVPVRRWSVLNCWPSEMVPMSNLNSKDSNDSFESLKLVNEGFRPVAV